MKSAFEIHNYHGIEIIPKEMVRLVGSKTGLVHDISQILLERDDPEIYGIGLTSCNIERLVKLPIQVVINSSGFGLTLVNAFRSALGEFVERYSLCCVDNDSIIFASYNQLKRKGIEAINPRDLPFFSRAQYQTPGFPYRRFTGNTKLGWTEGVSLITKRRILYPAQFIYLTYGYIRKKDEPLIGYATTSGCAAAFSVEEALRKSIEEQIERDAVMITWYAMLSPRKLNISSNGFLNDIFVDRFLKPNVNYTLLHITLDIKIPVFLGLCVTYGDEGPVTMMGASANLDPFLAALKALIEAGQGKPAIKYYQSVSKYTPVNPKDMVDLKSNVRFYAQPENFHFLSFLLSSKRRVSLNQIQSTRIAYNKEAVQALVKILANKQMHPIAFDLTPPDIRDLGFHVTRVIIPECMQLGIPANPPLGCQRLYQILKSCKSRQKISENATNEMPHPFG